MKLVFGNWMDKAQQADRKKNHYVSPSSYSACIYERHRIIGKQVLFECTNHLSQQSTVYNWTSGSEKEKKESQPFQLIAEGLLRVSFEEACISGMQTLQSTWLLRL